MRANGHLLSIATSVVAAASALDNIGLISNLETGANGTMKSTAPLFTSTSALLNDSTVYSTVYSSMPPHLNQNTQNNQRQHHHLLAASIEATRNAITAAANTSNSTSATIKSGNSLIPMRLALTITHLLLVSLGTVNLLIIFIILLRQYMRTITNVYMLSLCLADFIYLTNLSLVAATQLNDKSWPFGSIMCTIYHGTETTGKYASVLFVVLLAVDRYCAMCQSNKCVRYRNFRIAITLSLIAWALAIFSAFPLYYFAEVALLKFRNVQKIHKLCIAKWPNSESARWYITVSSVLIFALPLALIIFCYYHILNKMREALKSCRRMKRGARSRAPYHRVTRLVLWVVVFHVICWTPFWLFNLFSSIFRLRISTQFDRIVINIIHLFPYLNCALNPLLYATHAENFRTAFRSLFCQFGNTTLATQNTDTNPDTILKHSIGGVGVTSSSSLYNEGESGKYNNGAATANSVLSNGYASFFRSSVHINCTSQHDINDECIQNLLSSKMNDTYINRKISQPKPSIYEDECQALQTPKPKQNINEKSFTKYFWKINSALKSNTSDGDLVAKKSKMNNDDGLLSKKQVLRQKSDTPPNISSVLLKQTKKIARKHSLGGTLEFIERDCSILNSKMLEDSLSSEETRDIKKKEIVKNTGHKISVYDNTEILPTNISCDNRIFNTEKIENKDDTIIVGENIVFNEIDQEEMTIMPNSNEINNMIKIPSMFINKDKDNSTYMEQFQFYPHNNNLLIQEESIDKFQNNEFRNTPEVQNCYIANYHIDTDVLM